MNKQYKGWEIVKMIYEGTIKEDTELKCIATNNIFKPMNCIIRFGTVCLKDEYTRLENTFFVSKYCIFEIKDI